MNPGETSPCSISICNVDWLREQGLTGEQNSTSPEWVLQCSGPDVMRDFFLPGIRYCNAPVCLTSNCAYDENTS
jgi:hypothetical protein